MKLRYMLLEIKLDVLHNGFSKVNSIQIYINLIQFMFESKKQ